MPIHSKGPYRHRRERNSLDDSKRLTFINKLVASLLTLERRTVPVSGAEAVDDKDRDAYEALRILSLLAEQLAGWAIDHQIGLALNGLEFVPGHPSGARDHPDYLRVKARADSHEHEARGSAYFQSAYFELDIPTERNARAERRMLANLLYANPGGFPISLARSASEALKALDWGETQDLLRPEKTGRDEDSYTTDQLKLRALMHVEYFNAQGTKKNSAQTTVGDAYGRGQDIVRGWEPTLREILGTLEVTSMLSVAENLGVNAKAAKADKSNPLFDGDFERSEAWLGESALQENGQRFQAIARAAPRRR